MSRRREAAELARVLALSTQQTRDIAEISPHSLSSEHAAATQDSRDMELKMLIHTSHAGMGPSEDEEVGLFSSHSAEDQVNLSHIQSFNAPASLDTLQQDQRSSQLPSYPKAVDLPRHTHIAHLHAAGIASDPSSDMFSPTQLSLRTDAEATDRPLGGQDKIPHRADRTPLRARPVNQLFELSLSPEEQPSSSKRKEVDRQTDAIQVVSDADEIEVVDYIRPRTTTPASVRAKLKPEIILQSRTASRAESRSDSPDPLDLIPENSAYTPQVDERRSAQPHSSATETSNIVASGRKSSRVQAAAEKKEQEKEERRRIRRERKLKEEQERRVSGDITQSTSKRQKNKASSEVLKQSATSTGLHREPSTAAGPSSSRSTEMTKHGRPAAREAKRKRQSESVAVEPLEPDVELDDAPISITAEEEECVVAVSLSPAKPAEVADEATKPTLRPPKSPTPDEPEVPVHDTKEPTASVLHSMPSVVRQREMSASSSSARQSPGPAGPDGRPQRPQGIKWQTSRDDLSGVLAKFGGARPTGMSRRHRIAPLHSKIGPPAKALPPVPQKPVKKKKGEESEEEDSDDGGSEDEDGNKKSKSKVKGIEWFMVED